MNEVETYTDSHAILVLVGNNKVWVGELKDTMVNHLKWVLLLKWIIMEAITIHLLLIT